MAKQPIDTSVLEPAQIIYKDETVTPTSGDRGFILTPDNLDVKKMVCVPQVNQKYDTHDHHHGWDSCGVASAAQWGAYYRMIAAMPFTISVPTPHVSYYGHHVSESFEWFGRKLDAKTPNKGQRGWGSGLYGHIMDKIGRGWGTHYHSPDGRGLYPTLAPVFEGEFGLDMSIYLKRDTGTRFLNEEAGTEKFMESLDNGHPPIISGYFDDRYDHLAVLTGYGYFNGELHWILNDPYGDLTTGKTGGRSNVRKWSEFKPKWAAMVTGAYVPEETELGMTFDGGLSAS